MTGLTASAAEGLYNHRYRGSQLHRQASTNEIKKQHYSPLMKQRQCLQAGAHLPRQTLHRRLQPIAKAESSPPTSRSSSSVRSVDNINIGTKDEPLYISRMGCGTWNWGNKLLWGYDEGMDSELEAVFNHCLDNNINLFDTGDSYGTGRLEGRAETLLGQFSQSRGINGSETPNAICIATKLAAYPWRLTRASMVKAIEASVQRLKRDPTGGGDGADQAPTPGFLELGQMHWAPSSYGFGFQETALIEGLGDAYDLGLIKAIGLSNFGPKSIRKVHGQLKNRGIRLSTVQVQLSLLSYEDYQREVLDMCNELNITVIGYSPLCLGLLSGQYSTKGTRRAVPSGPRSLLANQLLPGIEKSGLLDVLEEIADEQSASVPQVALAWCMAKGAVPIPGARNLSQCKSNVAALSIELDEAQIAELDAASKRAPGTVQNSMRSM